MQEKHDPKEEPITLLSLDLKANIHPDEDGVLTLTAVAPSDREGKLHYFFRISFLNDPTSLSQKVLEVDINVLPSIDRSVAQKLTEREKEILAYVRDLGFKEDDSKILEVIRAM